MPKEKRADIQAVLQQLNLAFRALKLYPETHVMAEKNAADLFEKVGGYLSRYGPLDIGVLTDALMVDGFALGQEVPGLNSLARHLFRLKLDSLVIEESVDQHQLTEFIKTVCLERDEVLEAGGIDKLLRDRGVTAVIAFQPELRVTDETGVLTTEPENAELSASKIDYARLRKILLAEVDPTKNSSDELRNFLAKVDSHSFADILKKLNRESHDNEKIVETIINALSELDKTIVSTLPDKQEQVHRKMVEALLTLGEPMLAALAPRLIKVDLTGSNDFMPKLLEQFSNRELVTLIGLYFKAEDFSQEKIVQNIRELPFSYSRLKDLTPLLAKELSLNKDILRGFFQSVLEQEDAMIAAIKNKKKAAGKQVGTRKLSQLKQQIDAASSESRLMMTVLRALGETLAREKDPSCLAKIADIILEILSDGLEAADYDLAVEALSLLVKEADTRAQKEDADILATHLGQAGSKKKIEKITDLLEHDGEIHIKSAKSYLSLLGSRATSGLLDILAAEERPSRRRILCKLIASCSQSDLEGFAGKLGDSRWYVVRNVVYILGEIGREDSITYLEEAMRNSDNRVRIETVKALAKLGPKTFELLSHALGDSNRQIRLETVKALGKIRNQTAVVPLLEILESPDILGRNTDMKVEAAISLGGLRAGAARPTLERLQHRRSLLFRGKSKKVGQAAQEALARISGG